MYVRGQGEAKTEDFNGNLINILTGIYQDITERKRAEEKLTKSEEKLPQGSSFENVQDVYFEVLYLTEQFSKSVPPSR